MFYFKASISVSMVECMEELMVEIMTLICRISFWVVERSYDKVLKCASRYWLQVWAMVKVGHEKGVGGSTQKGVMRDGYHDNQDEKGNPMG